MGMGIRRVVFQLVVLGCWFIFFWVGGIDLNVSREASWERRFER